MFFEGAHDGGACGRRNVRIEYFRGNRRHVQDGLRGADDADAGVVGHFAREQAIGQHAQRVDIRPLAHAAKPRVDLFGRETLERADDRAALGGARGGEARIAQHPRDAQVDDPRAAAFAHEHIAALEVAVDDAGVVGGGQRLSDVADDRDALVHPRPVQRCPVEQRLGAGDEFHGDPCPGTTGKVAQARAKQPRDARVVDGGQRGDLPTEPCRDFGVGSIPKHLDRGAGVGRPRLVDNALPPLAENAAEGPGATHAAGQALDLAGRLGRAAVRFHEFHHGREVRRLRGVLDVGFDPRAALMQRHRQHPPQHPLQPHGSARCRLLCC